MIGPSSAIMLQAPIVRHFESATAPARHATVQPMQLMGSSLHCHGVVPKLRRRPAGGEIWLPAVGVVQAQALTASGATATCLLLLARLRRRRSGARRGCFRQTCVALKATLLESPGFPADDYKEVMDQSRHAAVGDAVKDETPEQRVRDWYAAGAQMVLAVTNSGMEDIVARELRSRYSLENAPLGGRVIFPCSAGQVEGLNLHSASRLVLLFHVGFNEDLEELRRSEDMYGVLRQRVAAIAREALQDAMPASLKEIGEARPLRFNARCRVNGDGAEKLAFGSRADWSQLKLAVRGGIEDATSWTLTARSQDVEANIIAFIGDDHLLLGIEAPEEDTDKGLQFPWSSVPLVGMQAHLAGAMAALALEAALSSGAADSDVISVLDPTCGAGTLLLAAARVWSAQLPSSSSSSSPQRPKLQLLGCDVQQHQVDVASKNLAACGLADAAHIQVGTCREALEGVPDGSVDAVLCDLPCGDKWATSAENYSNILRRCAQLLRPATSTKPGGRCVLLSNRRRMLSRAVAEGPWELVGSWVVGRGEGNLRDFMLIVLERTSGDCGAAQLDVPRPARQQRRHSSEEQGGGRYHGEPFQPSSTWRDRRSRPGRQRSRSQQRRRA
eukprot:TRINITY_DN19280_c0_g1_i2.p1 TRINITY_DN19280_c0_g1~~TRINITY_DN19280_c0_g1_i2.p1  ORF type:complete len:615 (-),score=116.77 TRINITY_DN19280_c0_g1_i2:46-1890(-)